QMKVLESQEKAERDTLNQQLQQALQPVQAQIQQLKTQEDTEIRQETEKLYLKILDRELRNYFVLDSQIEGIQLIFKGALTINGILTAADFIDVDNKGNILKRNGEWINLNALTVNKVQKLWEWRQKVVGEIRKKFPQALSSDQKNTVRQKYTPQIQQLSKQETDLQADFALKMLKISDQYVPQIRQLQLMIQALNNPQKIALQQQISQQKQVISQTETYQTSLQQKLQAYKNIGFWRYLLKMAWLIN
ncbi:MAG: hypothetical protein H7Y04_14785, partial [Verrucomicrobia bacterium]|nr:hypothetical protein [Cytophagales bacterium]